MIIPARDEAHALPHLLRPLVEQRRDGDRIVVVDDHSSDGTARVARAFDAEVVTPPPPPAGWLGKPNACWHGALATSEEVLVFLDADVRPGPTLLDDLAAAVASDPAVLVSLQPWHRMSTVGEQPSILCNVTALMGCGAFTVLGDRIATNVAFGPVVAVDRSTYDAVGGHAAPIVRVDAHRGHRSRPCRRTLTALRRITDDDDVSDVSRWVRCVGPRMDAQHRNRCPVHPMVAGAGDDGVGLFDRRRMDRGTADLPADRRADLGARSPSRDHRPPCGDPFPMLVFVFAVIFVRSAVAVVFRRDVTGRAAMSTPGAAD